MPVMAPVERVRALCDPFTNPWTEEPFTPADVCLAIEQGRFQPNSFSSTGHPSREWVTKDHIERIAYLAVNGWDGALEIDVGIPSMGFAVEWPVQDGNHRLAAAIVRNDAQILCSVAGQVDFANQLLGVDIREDDADDGPEG